MIISCQNTRGSADNWIVGIAFRAWFYTNSLAEKSDRSQNISVRDLGDLSRSWWNRPVEVRIVYCGIWIATAITIGIPTNDKLFRFSEVPSIDSSSYHAAAEGYEKQTHENVSASSIPNWSTTEIFWKFQIFNLWLSTLIMIAYILLVFQSKTSLFLWWSSSFLSWGNLCSHEH